MAERTVLDELDDRIKEIKDLIELNKKSDALQKLNALNQEITAIGSRGRSERNMSFIRGSMLAQGRVAREINRGSLEAPSQEEEDCLVIGNSVDGDTSGVSDQYLERNSNGIVIGFDGSNKNRTCLNRSVLTAENLRNALVEVCTEDQQPNGELYINMRKLGLITDAIVSLEEVLGYLVGDTENKRFDLYKKLDDDGDHEQVLVIGYGVAGMFRGDDNSEKANRIYWINQQLMNDYGLTEEELPIADPELVSPSLENFIEVSNAVSAAHCEPGDEKSIYHIKPANGDEFDYKSAYNQLVGQGLVRAITTYNYDQSKLNNLLQETINIYQERAQPNPDELLSPGQASYDGDDPYELLSPGQVSNYSEVGSIERIINCAFGEYYRTGGIFDQKEQEKNNSVSPEDLNKMKVKHIYSKHWVDVVLFGGDDECSEEEMQQTPGQCIYITPEILEDIATDYVEKRFREGKISEEERQQLKDGIRSFGLENTKRELSDLKGELYDRIDQELTREEEEGGLTREQFMIINEEDRSQDAPTPELIAICGDVISLFSDELVSRNCDSHIQEQQDRTPTEVARRLSFGEDDNISSAETESVDEGDKYEKLIYCAFGKWYGEDGKFEQLSKDQASGDGDPEPTINEITNEKMIDIFSDQWKTVLLDRSSESYHNVGGWDREGMTRIFESLDVNMDDPNTKPLDEAKLISITKSYIEEDDLWSTAQAKNEEIQKLESWASEGNPIKDLLNNIQATLYDKINRIAAEAARRAAGDDIDENDDNVGYWDDHNSQLLDICTIEIDDYTAQSVRNNCLGGLTQQRSDTPDYDPSFQPDDGDFYSMNISSAETESVVDSDDEFLNRAGEVEAPGSQDSFIDDISEIDIEVLSDGPLLTPVSSLNRSRSSSPTLTPDDGGPMSPSDFNGGKKKKRRKSKKGKKTRKKKAKKNKKKKKTKRRVKFNLKNNEYYTITPKNKIRKNKKRGTRKKKH